MYVHKYIVMTFLSQVLMWPNEISRKQMDKCLKSTNTQLGRD